MKVCLYLEAEQLLKRSGFARAFRNHVRALTMLGIDVTTDPCDTYDLLHLHYFGPRSWRLLWRARRLGIPVVIHAHSIGRYDFVGGFTATGLLAPAYERFLDRFYRGADALFAPSKFARRLLMSRGHSRVFVVSNGVDTEKFRFRPEARTRWRDQLGLKRFTVFCAGNLLPRKGVIEFVEVARALPDLDFVWFGKRWPKAVAFHPRMDQALRRAPANLHLPGFVEEPEGAFAAGDLFLFPTRGETQSLVVLEAAALRRPLVLRDVPAFAELAHGVQCLKGTTVEEFIAHIQLMAEEPLCRLALSEEAYRWAMGHSLPEVGRRLVSLYRAVLEGDLAVEEESSVG